MNRCHVHPLHIHTQREGVSEGGKVGGGQMQNEASVFTFVKVQFTHWKVKLFRLFSHWPKCIKVFISPVDVLTL